VSLPHLDSSGSFWMHTSYLFREIGAVGSVTFCLRVGGACAPSSCAAMWELHLLSEETVEDFKLSKNSLYRA